MSGSNRYRLAAVVLSGGTAERLGGRDKASLEVAGTTLLDHALAAVSAADEVVVVGDQVPTSRPVTWAREDPAGGGPAAGLLAGIDALARPAALVCVLACDMPRVTVQTFARLVAAAGAPDVDGPAGRGVDGAVLVDGRRRQTLCGVYRHASLLRSRPVNHADEAGMPVRRLIGDLRLVDVPARGDEAHDVDTDADLRRLRG